MRFSIAHIITLLSLLLSTAAFAEDAKPVVFSKDVAPILLKHCLACHGPTDPKGDYQLHTFTLAKKAGESGLAAFEAAKPDDSELLRRIVTTDKEERMPKDADPLSAEQIATIKRWIVEGAKFDGPDPQATLASIVPKTAQPDPPESYRVPMPITAVAFSPNGQELAVGGYHEITVWDPVKGTLLRRIKNVAERTYGLIYNKEGTLLAAASGTPGIVGEVKLFDPAAGTVAKDLGSMADVAFGVAFNPAGTKLAACGADRSIRIYDVASGKEERLIEDHADWVLTVAWNNDGTRLVSGSRDKTSKLFDAANGESLATYPGHSEAVYSAAFSEDGKQVFTGGGDKKVHVWNPADGKKIADMPAGGDVYDIVVQAGQVFCCSSDKTARQFTAADRKQVKSLAGHADWVYTLSYNDATKRLATGSFDGEVRVWNSEDGKAVVNFKAAPGYTPPQTTSK